MKFQRKTRQYPNHLDPLGEASVHRRIWAAYLAAGFNRNTWADALGLSYQAVDQYDIGRVTPKLDTLLKMVGLLRGMFTLEELAYGRNVPRHTAGVESVLTEDAIRALLFEVAAGPDAVAAFGMHFGSDAGKFVRWTRSYITAFVERYALARREGLDTDAAIDAAKTTAGNAQANVAALAAGVKPHSTAQAEALGRRVKEAAKNATERTQIQPVKKRKRAR
jgi:hypothetical protein